ncbi:DEP domain-containing protein 5-like protein [Dinothrombium tinctorium]|uniref:DEP domain-containing protein 5-like protein n=1 Tax=Dinothrombium tinctorium TaxID=1965070 RepID=A0A443RMN5_9ACAR|nr:DEP domain-containing protein 5-like protein [Dinothrombium tinctorium]
MEEEVIISEKDCPGLKIGDVIEIYTPEDDFSHLLLQVKSFAEEKDYQQKDKPTVSIEQSIAATFQLRTYGDVIVNIVDPRVVTLDSVEVFFKDQYLSRSDMWRMKKILTRSCVYLHKKIEINGIRCNVFEMWAQGERVASGYVDEDTKIVYRSTSSMVYLFLQMSSEMWDFDINGDLYFEKAVNGFLANLFEKWKRFNCNHDVTIVLFSRTFYDAKSIDEFPEYMKECLQQDYKGRFYEDFYRVPVQNERYDDWSSILILLKKLFNQYEKEVLRYHERASQKIPRAFNSTSSQGNFLEVLNMSLNVFEKHYMDRSFDRTGQLSVVISPGVGVFEVDFDLTNITKQRIIDNGIGSDLVCLGEQPLHAVPLFKFNHRQAVINLRDTVDIYNMPHWINLSFYSSAKQTNFPMFVPRIKMPNILLEFEKNKKNKLLQRSPSRDSNGKSNRNMHSFINYDEYDNLVFKPPSHSMNTTYTCQPSRRKFSVTSPSTKLENTRFQPRRASDTLNEKSANINEDLIYTHRNVSETISIPSPKNSLNVPSSNLSSSIESKSTRDIKLRLESQDDLVLRGCHGSPSGLSTTTKPKALINPFDPSHLSIKLTSNRRRWTHVFPLGPTGIFMQQHHYQAVPQNTASTLLPSDAYANPAFRKASVGEHSESSESGRRYPSGSHIIKSSDFTSQNYERKTSPKGLLNTSFLHNDFSKTKGFNRTSSILTADPHTDKSLTWAWGATGEQEWTPAITTGVDWKSLVAPACLPITTDFFPDSISLQNDYVTSCYNVSLEDYGSDLSQRRSYRGDEDSRLRCALTIAEVYQELICQRLQQGFQIILDPKCLQQSQSYPQGAVQFDKKFANKQKTMLSIGRIFHSLELENSEVKVTQYRPRHPYQTCKIHYCYRFRAPDDETYGVSWVDFASEKLENYNWSYLDSYICLRGEEEYKLMESLKFWRFRLLLLPSMISITKKITESISVPVNDKPVETHCDLYSPLSQNDFINFEEGFLKFIEMVNRIRRPPTSAKKWRKAERVNHDPPARRFSFGHSSFVPNNKLESHFRDRIGSTTDHDRPKPKVLGKNSLEKVRDDIANLPVSKLQQEAIAKSPSEKQSEPINESKKLKINSQKKEIIEYMKTSDFYFLNKQGGLPMNTFISAEAVVWAMECIDGVDYEEQAVSLFQEALQEHLICHASGDFSHSFKFGFYLYFIVDKNTTIQNVDLEMFKREWFEVELNMHNNFYTKDFDTEVEEAGFVTTKPKYIKNKLMRSIHDFSELNYNKTILDLDSGGKNDRAEWVHVKYSSVYDPGQAFEMILEWMVATANQIADVVQAWARKANQVGLHLMPIPSDPFALPFSGKSDPLRGPIFVTLSLACLPPLAISYLTDDNLLRFQERILYKFGFLPFCDVAHEVQRQYVHVSGSLFVLIPNRKLSQGEQNKVVDDVCCGAHEEYITRHFSGIKQTENHSEQNKIGFLWSWNYMITKRWKTPATGDETFQRRVLKDFRLFCANDEDRLRSFWDAYEIESKDDNDSMPFI